MESNDLSTEKLVQNNLEIIESITRSMAELSRRLETVKGATGYENEAKDLKNTIENLNNRLDQLAQLN